MLDQAIHHTRGDIIMPSGQRIQSIATYLFQIEVNQWLACALNLSNQRRLRIAESGS